MTLHYYYLPHAILSKLFAEHYLYRESMSIICFCALTSHAVLFAARRVCIARTVLSQDVRPSVCPSVCPSHAGILPKRQNIFSNSFLPSGSHTTLVFPNQTV